MACRIFKFEGFEIRVETEALWGLVMSHLPGKDLRSAERIIGQVFFDLLLRAQTCHGLRIAQGTGALEFHLRAAQDLKDHCTQLEKDLEVRVHLLTSNSRLAEGVRTMLPERVAAFEAGPEKPTTKAFPWGGLLLIDCLPMGGREGLQPVTGLDRMVQRYLVDAKTFAELTAQDQACSIPVQGHPSKGPISLQKDGLTALTVALDEALFSRIFFKARSLNQRWKTRLVITVSQEGNQVEAVLHFNGMERVLQARDLKLDIGWGEIPEVRLNDVLGLASSKARIREFLDWLKDPQGLPGLKAAVLSGPPGVGKTFLCMAAAGEAGVPCIIVGAAQFHDKYYGETERIIRETFSAAQKYNEAVVVIDELDALAWSRDQSNDWMAQTQSSIMGALLTAVDKLRKGPGRVLLLCTTNHFDRIDSALTRSLRVGERIHVGLPGAEDRRAILEGMLMQKLETEALNEVTAMTAGMSPADLVQLVEAVKKVAALAGVDLSMEQFRQAIFETRRGEVNSSLHLTETDKKRVAWHEAGHALLAHDLLGPASLAHLCIIPTAQGALGAAYMAKPDSAEVPDRSRLKCHLAVLLGGMAAETCLHPEAGAGGGVASDLAEATRLAGLAITAWGMDDTLPPLALEGLPLALQNVLAPRLMGSIQAWLAEAQVVAVTHLDQNRVRLDRLAEGLLHAETLHRPEILALLAADVSVST